MLPMRPPDLKRELGVVEMLRLLADPTVDGVELVLVTGELKRLVMLQLPSTPRAATVGTIAALLPPL